MTDVEKVSRFAERVHEGQFRKGPGKVPYIEHPAAVVALLKEWGFDEENYPFLFELAWAHDTYEDGEMDETGFFDAIGSLGIEYWHQVASGVLALSYVPEGELSDEEFDRGKDEYIRRIAKCAPTDVLLVKMSDRICNTRDFLAAGNAAKAKGYLALGRCLFDRVEAMPHSAEIRKTLAEIEAKL